MPVSVHELTGRLLLAGALIPLATAVGLAGLAPEFAWGLRLDGRPIGAFLSLMAVVSSLFLLFVSRLGTHSAPSKYLLFTFFVGFLARLLVISSTPILEDDFYRYQWDGAVTAAGLNPWAHPPARMVTDPAVVRLLESAGMRATPPPPGFAPLVRDGRQVLGRVNNPHVASIYPPLAQAGFAIGHWLTPWRLTGWKLVVLAAELLTLAALAGALRAAGKPLLLLTIYWWNPLVLKELANSAHMEALLLPVIAAALWLGLAQRQRAMALMVGVAAAIKLWPLLLLAPLSERRGVAIGWAVAASVLMLLLLGPQLLALGDDAGLVRYAGDWQRNALIFPVLAKLFGDGGARLAVAGIVAALAAWLWWRGGNSVARVVAGGHVVLALLLLSPTLYPWYVLWLLPFAVVAMQPAWAWLIAMAPAYYLLFWLQAQGLEGLWLRLPPLLSAGPALAALWLHRKRA